MKSKHLKAFTLIELEIVLGITLSLFIIGFVSYGNVRKDSIDNRTIADVNNVNIQLQSYFRKYGNYPANLQALVTDGLIASVPKVANTSVEIAYQRGYTFINDEGLEVGNDVNDYNPDWYDNYLNKASNLPTQIVADLSERKKFYYADFDNRGNPNGSCYSLRIPNDTKTLYRLGAPLWRVKGVAKEDATPCTDRFYDIIVKSEG